MAASIAAACLEGASAPKAFHRIERIGLQLYTVRGTMQKDFAGTIAKVAATGYQEVEFAGYFDHSPKEIRATLDKNGLSAPSRHVDYAVVEKKWPESLEAAKIIGHSYVICGSVEEKQRAEPDGWKRAAELFNRAGEDSKKAGLQFGYHNHSFEFEAAESLGEKLPYDFLLAETNPKLVVMEMDLCWVSVPGKDPLAYFDQYPGRFPLVHVKDWVRDETVRAAMKEPWARPLGTKGEWRMSARVRSTGSGFSRNRAKPGSNITSLKMMSRNRRLTISRFAIGICAICGSEARAASYCQFSVFGEQIGGSSVIVGQTWGRIEEKNRGRNCLAAAAPSFN